MSLARAVWAKSGDHHDLRGRSTAGAPSDRGRPRCSTYVAELHTVSSAGFEARTLDIAITWTAAIDTDGEPSVSFRMQHPAGERGC
jgi:hypothetical protein